MIYAKFMNLVEYLIWIALSIVGLKDLQLYMNTWNIRCFVSFFAEIWSTYFNFHDMRKKLESFIMQDEGQLNYIVQINAMAT